MLANLAKSIKNATGGICFAVAQDSLGALNSLATAILGPTATQTTTFSASTPPPTSTSTVTSTPTPSTSTPTLSQTSTPTTSQGSPTSSSTPPPVPGPTSSRHLSTPAIVGAVVGGVLLGASFCVSLCTWFAKFPRSRSSRLRGSPARNLDGSGEYSDSRARGRSLGLII